MELTLLLFLVSVLTALLDCICFFREANSDRKSSTSACCGTASGDETIREDLFDLADDFRAGEFTFGDVEDAVVGTSDLGEVDDCGDIVCHCPQLRCYASDLSKNCGSFDC